MSRVCQGLQTIKDYKGKTSHVTDTDILLPYELNTFSHFEHNTLPQTRPAPKDFGLSFSVADVSKTFRRVNPSKGAGPDSIPSRILRACADQLAGEFMDIFNLPIPVYCPHLLQYVHLCSCTQEGKGN